MKEIKFIIIIAIIATLTLSSCGNKVGFTGPVYRPNNIREISTDNYNFVYDVFWNYYWTYSDYYKANNNENFENYVLINLDKRIKIVGQIKNKSVNCLTLYDKNTSWNTVDVCCMSEEESLLNKISTMNIDDTCYIEGLLYLKLISLDTEYYYPIILIDNINNIKN